MSDIDHQMNAVRECRTLGLRAARRVVEAALDRAEELNCLVSVVVLDAGGNVSALARQDTVAAAVTTVAHNKANTALTLRQPTDEFVQAVQGNQVLVVSLSAQPGFALMAGGLPLVVDGEVVGAVGVSGARDGKDLDIARAGAKALHA